MTSQSVIRRIRELAWRVLGPPPVVAVTSPLTRFDVLTHAVRNIEHNTRLLRDKAVSYTAGTLAGDYLEFGTYRGESFRHVILAAANCMPWMRFFAFDSFQGLPKIEGLDRDGAFSQGEYACSQAEFLRNVSLPDVDQNRITCIPGWYDQSLKPEIKSSSQLRVASIVNIDCDLYNSTVPVLEFVTDLVRTGTIILFDDWFCFNGDPTRGVQRACAEWLNANPDIRLQDWHMYGGFGKSFILVKADNAAPHASRSDRPEAASNE